MEPYSPRQENSQSPDCTLPAPFDPSAVRREMSVSLAGSQEIDDLVSQIYLDDLQTIVRFGVEAASRLARCSDEILNSVSAEQVHDAGALFQKLGSVMERFDPEEITSTEPQGLSRLFGGPRRRLDQLLVKYRAIGEQVDQIYVELKQYEAEIEASNRTLQTILDTAVQSYQDLVKYVLAGEQGLREMDQYLAQGTSNPDGAAMRQARAMLDRRVMDLHLSEQVAVQSISMVQSMQFSNLTLMDKIHSAFLVTLPVFRQTLAQAVLLKRQRLQSEAMRALERRTSEMLLKNARSASEQAKMAALSSGASASAGALEQTWRTIVSGIAEARQIQEEAGNRRSRDAAQLETLKRGVQQSC